MLSQFCRRCKGNNAGYLDILHRFSTEKRALTFVLLYLILLTIGPQTVILGRNTLPSQEVIMSDEKLGNLRQSHIWGILLD